MAEKVFTVEQVAEHSSKNDCWMTIHGKVYNVTSFLDEHPGGEEVLLELAGQDGTEAFEEIGHSNDARDLLKKLLVGELDAKSVPKPKAPSAAPVPAPKQQASFGLLYALVPVIIAVLIWFQVKQ